LAAGGGEDRAREVFSALGYHPRKGEASLDGLDVRWLASAEGVDVYHLCVSQGLPEMDSLLRGDRGSRQVLLWLDTPGGCWLAARPEGRAVLLNLDEAGLSWLASLRAGPGLPEGLSRAFDWQGLWRRFRRDLALALERAGCFWTVAGWLFLSMLAAGEGARGWPAGDNPYRVTRDALDALGRGGEIWPGGPVAPWGGVLSPGETRAQDGEGLREALGALAAYPYTHREHIPGALELAIGPGALGMAYEGSLKGRKPTGRFYTPLPVALFAVGQALSVIERGDGPPRVADPGVGLGVYLVAAMEVLAAQDPSLSRERIVRECLHGVDMDANALEVARWRLFLAARDRGEPLRPFPSGNLVEGDSLEMEGFSWSRAFPQVFREGGFHLVVGNPPYLFGEQLKGLPKPKGYRLAKGQYDVAWLFWERSVNCLARPGGVVSLLTSDALLARDEPERVRRFLLENTRLEAIIKVGPVFPAGVSGAVVQARPGRPSRGKVRVYTLSQDGFREAGGLDTRAILAEPRRRFLVEGGMEVLTAMRASGPILGTHYKISRGEETSPARHVHTHSGLPVVAGRDVKRLVSLRPSMVMDPREARKDHMNYLAPKAVLVKTGRLLRATLDYHGFVTLQSVYNLRPAGALSVEFLAGLLASKALNYYVVKVATAHKGIFPQLNQSTVLELPLPGGDPAPLERRVGELYGTGMQWDGLLDGIVYALYGLTAPQVKEVEDYFAAGCR
jgi:hypothetical protein